MTPSTGQVKRLMEIGLVAAGNGYTTDAETIFAGIQAVRPESELPVIGRAFVKMNSGQLQDSIHLLRAALERNPDSDLALSFLGAALKFSGHNHAAEDAFSQVAEAGLTTEAVEMAKALAQNPA